MNPIRKHKKEIIVILDDIRSAFNVGAILRTSDGAGVQKVFLCGITPDVNHPKILKTALGAQDYIETKHFKTTQEAIAEARAEGYLVCAIEQSDNSISLEDIKNEQKLCLIFGNELSGVSPTILELSDKVVEIPMFGKKNSLNVATIAGIVLYYLVLD
jgi:23S rRNA (guanosine2251-2'-O)-methyltransferase